MEDSRWRVFVSFLIFLLVSSFLQNLFRSGDLPPTKGVINLFYGPGRVKESVRCVL